MPIICSDSSETNNVPFHRLNTTMSGAFLGFAFCRPGALLFAWTAASADPAEIKLGYLRRTEPKTRLSLVEIPAENNGLAGAQVAIDDNNTTGKFLNQHFSIEDMRLNDKDDAGAAATGLADRGISLVIADLAPDALLKAADVLKSRSAVIFNVGATDDRLREEDCRANVIDVAPTRSMLADGLAQYLVWKQWRRWFLVVGSHAEDKLYADALRRAGQALRSADRPGKGLRRYRRSAAEPTAVSSRSSANCPCSRRVCRPTTCW